MAEVGSYYISIVPSMSGFTKSVKAQLGDLGTQSGTAFNSSFIDIVRGSAIGTALGNVASSIGSLFMEGISTGISRLDTLENFPRVMESFGYSAESASAAVEMIMEHLRGLPTASQDVVTLTQAISDSTGDLDTAARAALGFNDMLLAAGASSQETATATGVLNRVLGKQSATAAQWQSIVSVMPKQMSMVAESMLGAGASTEDLHAALEDGTVSWNDMLDAIIKLDEEGTGAVSSFAEQAKANSIGIGSSLQNIQNRIGAGWANVLKAIGQQEIHDLLENVADGLKAPLDALADGISYLKEKIGETSIFENAATVFQTIGEAIASLWQDGGPEMLQGLADSLINLADNAFQWLADHGEVVTAAVYGIVGALAAMAGFKIAGAITTLPALFTALSTAMMACPFITVVTLIAAVATALYGFFTKTEAGQKIVQKFGDLMGKTWEGLKRDTQKMVQIIKREWDSFKSTISNAVNNIKTVATNTFTAMKQIVINIWTTLKAKVGDTVNNLKTTVSNVWNGIKTAVTNTVNTIKTTITNIWNAIKTAVTTTVNTIKSTITGVWDGIKTSVSTKVNELKTSVSTAWDAVKTTASTKWNNVKSTISSTWDGIKSTVNSKVNEFKTNLDNGWSRIKSGASTQWDGIKSTITNKFGDAKSAVSTKLGEMRTAITGFSPTFKAIAAPAIGSVSGALDSIRSAITSFAPRFSTIAAPVIGSISGALDTIRTAVSNFLPSFPQISWPIPSMPHIPLPHFSISWSSILGGVVKVPHVSFDGWWAKGGIFDQASIIGIGEAGREAALPLNARTYGEIAKGISTQMGGSGGVVITGNTFYVREEADIDRIADALERKWRRERMAIA